MADPVLSKSQLDQRLSEFEAKTQASGQAELTIRTRIEHARRFVDWTRGGYVVDGRSYSGSGNPVDLQGALAEYRRELQGSSLAEETVRTYSYHSGIFVRWLTAQSQSKPSPVSFWLETTDRDDIGLDLNAPQFGESGRAHHAYKLITDVEHGDIVFHYSTPKQAVVAWSRVVGTPFADTVIWGTHAGRLDERAKAHARPGWRVGLEGPYLLDGPITLADLRGRESDIRAIHTGLAAAATAALYFPFELSTKRAMRPTQFYLTKLPREVVALFPVLQGAAEEGARTTLSPAVPRPPVRQAAASGELGMDYQSPPAGEGTSRSEPFSPDPDVIDRGKRGHRDTQEELADHIRAMGSAPRSPRPDEPRFDAAWELNGVLFVAEVNSLTSRNEEKQLRLGLGQVLRYRHLIASAMGKEVRAVLAVERAPADSGWAELCTSLGVILVWRGHMRLLS
jgi:predicted RNA-binding protein with PUA-like domain